MKIRVSYSKLQSDLGYNNRRAEAEIEVEVDGDLSAQFDDAWKIVREQVERQLRPEVARPEQLAQEEDVPF